MDKETQIIGTFHMDLASPEIMEKVLDKVKPDILVGEANEALDLKTKVRDMIWATVFDRFDIDEELQRKFYALENDKEHSISRAYAYRNRIPYYLIDAPEESNHAEVTAFARRPLAESFANDFTAKQGKKEVIDYIKRNFARHFEAQDKNPPCARLYDIETSLKPTFPQLVEDRDQPMAQELIRIMNDNPGKSILGFFGLIHGIDPFLPKATELFGGPFENMRFHLRDRNVKFSKLIDWV